MPATISAEEIKQIRGKYGLSQRSFAQLLGIGPASMVRYEQGTVPSKANTNLIRAARNPEFMAECLEADGDLIPKKQRIRAESIIYDYISLDPEEDERMHEGLEFAEQPQTMTMDEMYHFTLQQEILNEQAANIIADLISMKPFAELDKEEGIYSHLLRQLAQLKPTIVSAETRSDDKLSEIRGFLACAQTVVSSQIAEVA